MDAVGSKSQVSSEIVPATVPATGPATVACQRSQLFRLWLATYTDWRPLHWHDVPPLATALELVADETYSAGDARVFVEGFNSEMLEMERQLWVVAIPVALRLEGDARPGDRVRGHAFAERSVLSED
jgi:hypothetical protein